MRINQKRQAEEFVKLLGQVHDEIRKSLQNRDISAAQGLLADCQTGAIELGNLIEKIEGENCKTISILEDYCEQAYHIYENIEQENDFNIDETLNTMCQLAIKIEDSIKNDIRIRKEVVFLPYKASMWDSLESVWKAANEDPDCDAYVVPIPYYDKNPDNSFGEMHYEGNLFPEYVPIVRYYNYDLDQRRPDMIFIHNPYDDCNRVTSVHPDYFSHNLKKYTDLLVYIPYYATSGNMNEGRGACPAYYNVDYIILQAEKYRSFFDSELPQDRLLPLGSPKFDRVINICNNPPEPPEEWKEKMAGKKVYFYNTSINGMLGNTEIFLRKMQYVFKCFESRKDVCLLWRPHPLLETSFDSMRPEYKQIFNEFKKWFFEKKLGIYDNTPDITNTIALCDAYIGDSASSVTSLFGIAGKPLFIFNNYVNTLPTENDCRGQTISLIRQTSNDSYMVTNTNKLYYAPDNDYRYKYYCDLSDYSGGGYYSQVITIKGKNYVCPANACDILVVENNKVTKRIELPINIGKVGAFCGAVRSGDYLFLIPDKYPGVVRYDTVKDRIDCFSQYYDIIAESVNGERRTGGFCERKGYIYIGSPVSNLVLAIEAATGREIVLTTGAKNSGGCLAMQYDGSDLWLLPYTGNTVTRWNPETGKMQEYDCNLEGFKCINPLFGYECVDKPFSSAAYYYKYVYLTPYFGSMYVRINKSTGEVTQWQPPFERTETIVNGYYLILSGESCFIRPIDAKGTGKVWRLFSAYDRKLYDIDFEKNEHKELEIEFNLAELKENEAGFAEVSEWLQYACLENAFNSLSDFLDGSITGKAFDKDKQICAFNMIAANNDGTSGKKIYDFMCDRLLG